MSYEKYRESPVSPRYDNESVPFELLVKTSGAKQRAQKRLQPLPDREKPEIADPPAPKPRKKR